MNLFIASLAAASLVPALSLAGPPNPPAGPVAPTYKTLGDIEPRTAITALPFTISQSGSYYLTASLSCSSGHGINVTAADVTIDLNGFTITGAGASSSGIFAGAGGRLTIRNGGVRGFIGSGINAAARDGCEIENVTAISNGGMGISVGGSSRVSRCVARSNGGRGISVGYSGIIESCTAASNSAEGLYALSNSLLIDSTSSNNSNESILVSDDCTVSRCTTRNGDYGIVAGNDCTIIDCTASSSAHDGISVQAGCTIRGNTCSNNGDDGIQITWNCHVTANTCTYNGQTAVGAGVYITASSTQNRVVDNHFTGNHFGILCEGDNNFIARNSCRGNNGGNFSVNANNELAPVITNPGLNSFGTMTPWSNIAY